MSTSKSAAFDFFGVAGIDEVAGGAESTGVLGVFQPATCGERCRQRRGPARKAVMVGRQGLGW